MRVRAAMTTDPVTVAPCTSVSEARRLMRRHQIRHLPVVDDGRLVGVLSDRDVTITDDVLAVALATLQSDLLGGRYRRVAEVMRTPMHTADPEEAVAVAAERMRQQRIGILPVVQGDRLIGVLGASDCLRLLREPPRPMAHPARGCPR